MHYDRLCRTCAPDEWIRYDSRGRVSACEKCGEPTENPYTANGRCPDCRDTTCDCGPKKGADAARDALEGLFRK